ncbi:MULTISPECIES: hypothetical protein [unclassified Cyanobium]|uniref:hypothetical protein n=1 Tax=unclassified Cyanobium TaxID=2627006 RepID=UPI0020CF3A3D|nr:MULTISPECIES: hypothetical protein [unclassified Cyanobium]MCP9860913.1 hypothetical protein [Cyanobium sp. Cruz-8H5]MCP9868157.1 hypothetical protein [Cyanobium sp. Cruz-8D1]
MASSRKPNPLDWGSSSSVRGLSLAGLVLLALYGSILLGSLFPIQLLASAWQLKLGSALINAAPFPLIGLGLLHLAAELDPQDSLLIQRRRICAQLAVAAALGFLLLVPLLSLAAVAQQQQRSADQQSLIRRADTNLQALRQVVSSANSRRELRDRLLALNGPVLNEADQALPLSTIKTQVSGVLDQAAAQVSRQSQQLPPASPLQLLPELLRNAFASLALAIGFAGLARSGPSGLSLLAELQQGWIRLRHRRLSLRRGAGGKVGNREYWRQLEEGAGGEGSSRR